MVSQPELEGVLEGGDTGKRMRTILTTDSTLLGDAFFFDVDSLVMMFEDLNPSPVQDKKMGPTVHCLTSMMNVKKSHLRHKFAIRSK